MLPPRLIIVLNPHAPPRGIRAFTANFDESESLNDSDDSDPNVVLQPAR